VVKKISILLLIILIAVNSFAAEKYSQKTINNHINRLKKEKDYVGLYDFSVDLINGTEKIDVDIEKAVKILTYLDDNKFKRASVLFYVLYRHPDYGHVDYKKSRYWLEKAVEYGLKEYEAQYALEIAYGELYGKPDVEKAEKLYLKYANNGNSYASEYLCMFYFAGKYFKKNYKKSLKWCNIAAEDGRVGSLGILANIYLFGYGVPKDELKACAYLLMVKWSGQLEGDKGIEQAYKGIYTEKNKLFIKTAEELAKQKMKEWEIPYSKKFKHLSVK